LCSISLPLTPSLEAVPVPEVNEIVFKSPLLTREIPESKIPYVFISA
jgi:hypothetical protein